MNEQEYLEQRLNDQIDWYEAKSARNQHRSKILVTTTGRVTRSMHLEKIRRCVHHIQSF